jgi:sialidase-1
MHDGIVSWCPWLRGGIGGLRAVSIRLLAVGMILIGAAARAVEVKVVAGGESAAKAVDCRRMCVGPGVNQPDPHPGYAGFVGWDAPLRLRDGTLLVSFSTGYWHASPPTPLRMAPGSRVAYQKMGMPTNIDAPRGGRAMLIRSTDDGRTWSKPRTIIDTPWDDRSPAMVELPDGTLVCSFFTYPGDGDLNKQPDLACRTGIIRSRDGGKTWEQTPRRLPSPFVADATDGPPVILKDGSVLLAVYGSPKQGMPEQVGIFRSSDSGQTWQLLSVVKSDHEMSETGLAQLPDGRLVLVTRPEGDIAWSSDCGRTWTNPVTFGMRMFEPGLLVLRDGTLLCLHGSYGGGGFRAILSGDGGKTWVAPAKNHGFAVDPAVYGYGRGIELPDGSILAVYIHTGGHSTKDAQTEALWAIRLRVRPDCSGVDLLPAPGR